MDLLAHDRVHESLSQRSPRRCSPENRGSCCFGYHEETQRRQVRLAEMITARVVAEKTEILEMMIESASGPVDEYQRSVDDAIYQLEACQSRAQSCSSDGTIEGACSDCRRQHERRTRILEDRQTILNAALEELESLKKQLAELRPST